MLDKYLSRIFAEEFGIQYIAPYTYCPEKYGFQTLESDQNNPYHELDPEGFCAFWSIFYADLRLTYPNLSRDKLVKYAAKEFGNMENITAFIRNYGVFILENMHVLKERKHKVPKLVKRT
jgi:hypothetical protein